ncbi:Glycine receptor subunit alpha-2 [Portunus trituberculatus]|uniref:Glycine receptor subunit alpha-2 n=1 Tax=Portunus trituberculatus TaxID=210409 RepID=A0A5B7CPX5_PORTR|nr:Glycine receptor subunit alpha-2 [Portunus trituberculatus]
MFPVVFVICSARRPSSVRLPCRQSSPETSYIKAVDVWMIACIVMSALMLFEYGIVLFIKKQHKEPAPAVKEEPPSRTAHVPPSAKSIKTAFELSVGREAEGVAATSESEDEAERAQVVAGAEGGQGGEYL